MLDLQTAPVLVMSKSLKRSPKTGAAHTNVDRGRVLQGRYLAPNPVVEGDKLKVPRSGDFVRQNLGVQGEEAIVLPLRAPCTSGNMWLSS